MEPIYSGSQPGWGRIRGWLSLLPQFANDMAMGMVPGAKQAGAFGRSLASGRPYSMERSDIEQEFPTHKWPFQVAQDARDKQDLAHRALEESRSQSIPRDNWKETQDLLRDPDVQKAYIDQAMGFVGGVETPTLTPFGGPARFLRGSKATAGKTDDPARAFMQAIVDARAGGNWDAPIMVLEHKTGKMVPYDADQGMTYRQAFERGINMKTLKPTILDETKRARFAVERKTASGEPAPGGVSGNEKTREINETNPRGTNTIDEPGCGRGGFCDLNDIPRVACWGGDCYAFNASDTRYNTGNTLNNNVQRPSTSKESEATREAILNALAQGKSLAEVNAAHPGFKVSAKDPNVLAEAAKKGKAKRKWSIFEVLREESPPGSGAYANKGSFTTREGGSLDGVSLRTIDNDASAQLSNPEVIAALQRDNPTGIKRYISSAYHDVPPSPAELRAAGREDLAKAMEDHQATSVINVTVGGEHGLRETVHRINWANQMRSNGWNVGLREVTADPEVFSSIAHPTLAEQRWRGAAGKDVSKAERALNPSPDFGPGYSTPDVYNRIHSGVMKTDFYPMEQPYHRTGAAGAPVTGLPSCCSGGNCSNCSNVEMLGRGYLKASGLDKDIAATGEQILPGVKNYHGNRPGEAPARGFELQKSPYPLDHSIPWEEQAPIPWDQLPSGPGPNLLPRTLPTFAPDLVGKVVPFPSKPSFTAIDELLRIARGGR